MALTPNLNLHIYDKDSKPTYLVDHNNDMTAIDQGYAALKLSTDTASTNVAGLTTQVNTVQQLAESASALATQANENSSHASADASAAVAAANNANTEAAKAVAATDGLINISDIELSVEGFTMDDGSVGFVVRNGILCGGASFSGNSSEPITINCNYNISGRLMMCDESDDTDRHIIRLPIFVNGSTTLTNTLTTTVVRILASSPWDPAWTKKTNS